MAKNRVIKVIGTEHGKCSMCIGTEDRDKEVLKLNSPGHTGNYCPEHFIRTARKLNVETVETKK